MTKLIFIGIDGMDPKLTESMMDSGKLPNFDRLREAGCYRRLETVNPPQSPVVWASIATGCNPGEHGVFDFIHRNPENYLPYLSILQFEKLRYTPPVKVPTFWELDAEQGISAVVLKWPVAFPPGRIKGRIMAGLGVPDIRGTLGLYTLFTSDSYAADGKKKGRIIPVLIDSNPFYTGQHPLPSIQTAIPGPFAGSLKGKKEATAQLLIELGVGEITCRIGKECFTLREGCWSDWICVKFDIGFFRTVAGNSRFFLKSIGPEFALYMTPVNVDYDSMEFQFTYPREYARELARAIGQYATLGMAEDTNGLNDEVLSDDAFIALCDSLMDERERMFEHEYARFDEGILACVFDTTDRIQHMFWRAIDSNHPLYDSKLAGRYGEVIASYYGRMDRIIGGILDRISTDTSLLICSDHGFAPFRREVHLNSWLVEQGFMVLKDGVFTVDGLFDGVDWEKTRAYAVGLTSLYLNVRGREGKGILEACEIRQVKADLGNRLLALEDKGNRVINRVHDSGVLYSGGQSGKAPDLVVGYCSGYRGSWQTAIGGVPAGDVITDNVKKWSGDHCCDGTLVPGVFFCNRADLSPCEHVQDIVKWIGDARNA